MGKRALASHPEVLSLLELGGMFRHVRLPNFRHPDPWKIQNVVKYRRLEGISVQISSAPH